MKQALISLSFYSKFNVETFLNNPVRENIHTYIFQVSPAHAQIRTQKAQLGNCRHSPPVLQIFPEFR